MLLYEKTEKLVMITEFFSAAVSDACAGGIFF